MPQSIIAYIMILLLALAPALGCEDPVPPETALFEEAEVYYRKGSYDKAIDGYQAFLRTYPSSPLAKTAEMRLRNIHREVSSMLGRKNVPRPLYHGSKLTESPTIQSSQDFPENDDPLYADD